MKLDNLYRLALSSTAALGACFLAVLMFVALGVSAEAADRVVRVSAINCGYCDEPVDLTLCDFSGDICTEPANLDETKAESTVSLIDWDIDDITALVNYIYGDAGTAQVRSDADIDGINGIDIKDLCLLVSRLFGEFQITAEQEIRVIEENNAELTNDKVRR
jgi:hypothetical protein